MGQRQAQGHTTAPSCAATSAKQSRAATFPATNVLSRCSGTGTQLGTAIPVDDLDPAEMMADVCIPNSHGLGCKPRGFGLASGPVQGEHEQLPQPLAERVFPAQRLQLADELAVMAQHQAGFGTSLDRHQGQVVQVRSLGIREA